MLSYPKAFEAVKKIAKKACETEDGPEIMRRYEEIYLAEEFR